MAQLPRCVQQASWKRVSGVCSLTLKSLSCSPVVSSAGNFRSAAASSVSSDSSSSSSGFAALRPSQSVLVLCGSSQKLSRSVYTDLTCDRLRFALRRSSLFLGDALSSSRNLSSGSGLPGLGTFVARSFSSSDASTVVDGEVKDSVSTEETETQRSSLVAEIESKERELDELRRALRLVDNSVDETEEHDAEEHDTNEQLDGGGEVVEAASSADLDTDSDSTSDDSDLEFEDESADVIVLGAGDDVAPSVSTSEEAEEENGSVASSAVDSETEKKHSTHPWPQWTRFLKHLTKGNYFANEEGKEIDIEAIDPEDFGLIKRACLNFARERDDIFSCVSLLAFSQIYCLSVSCVCFLIAL